MWARKASAMLLARRLLAAPSKNIYVHNTYSTLSMPHDVYVCWCDMPQRTHNVLFTFAVIWERCCVHGAVTRLFGRRNAKVKFKVIQQYHRSACVRCKTTCTFVGGHWMCVRFVCVCLQGTCVRCCWCGEALWVEKDWVKMTKQVNKLGDYFLGYRVKLLQICKVDYF